MRCEACRDIFIYAKRYPTLILAILFMVVFGSCRIQKTPSRPNIILILSDDMGYSDLGCYGSEISTPHLDSLAEDGLRFTQFYNTARCCPTRASLMTGCYPHQTGIGHMTNTPADFRHHDLGIDQYRGFLNNSCVTIAEVLRESGYHTLMTGKWHLGISSKDKWPLQRGFDRFYGIIPGACNYFRPEYPRGITLGNDTITISDPDYYTTDAFTDYAIQFIEESRQDGNDPFFLYLAYNAPHWPLNAPEENIEKYRGRYMEGWQHLREERYERMKKMGLVDPGWELTPQDSRDWDSLDEEKKKEMDLRMAIYAAQIDRMDRNIGRLVKYLEEKNIIDNTVIMLLNDNGACAEFDELGSGPAEELGTRKGYVLSYGRAWANASNTPYRKYKHWIHEGGIATPFIVHWPGGIPHENNGSLVNEYGFLPDIMATCVDLAGAEYPEEYHGHPIIPASGRSLVPLFCGGEGPVHTEPIFWEHEGNRAVRSGKYKLVQEWSEYSAAEWELYDLSLDRTEMHDLSGGLTDKREEMIRWYNEWAELNKVLPWDSINVLYGLKKAE